MNGKPKERQYETGCEKEKNYGCQADLEDPDAGTDTAFAGEAV